MDKGSYTAQAAQLFADKGTVMRDLVANFDKCEKEVSEYITGAVQGYYGHGCFKKLKARIENLRLCNDLKPAALRNNSWNSHVVFPIVKERSLLRRAITSANYRATDLYTLNGIGSTPPENAAQAELVLNLNMANTQYKMRTLKPSIDTASKFGTTVQYTYWKADETERLRTVYNPQTGRYDRVRSSSGRKNAYTCQVEPMDYFQNPDIPEPDNSDFQGHYKSVHISDLVPLLDDETYITENLNKVIEEIKKGSSAKTARPWMDSDSTKWGTDVVYFEGTIPIKGNEDGTQRYMVQMIGSTIIRMSVDDYDDDLRSYTVLNFDKRQEFWWGNSDSEYVVSHENFLNTFLSMTADNAMRSMMQYIFYRKDDISQSDINRATNGGFIGLDVKQGTNLSNLIMPVQPGSLNLGPAQYITQMVNDSVQKMSTKVDLSRRTDSGGGVQNNSTATAANIIAGQSDVLEADILENFDFGVSEVGRKSLVMLQQFLSELFFVRPRPQDVERLVNKYQILGEYEFIINTTAMKNKQGELLRMQNLATWLLNVMSNPMMQQSGYNVAPIVRDILQKAELPSIEDIVPKENEVNSSMGMVPSNPVPAAANAGQMMPMQQPQGMAA